MKCLLPCLAGILAAAAPAPDAALHWRLLGPFRGGWATMVEGIAAQENTFFFAAAGGGLWRTDDAGRTWSPRFSTGPASSVGALAVAPSDPNTIYIGTGQPEPRYDVTAGQGVYKSTDGGKNWTALGLEATKYIGKIWVSPSDPNTVLVGAQGHFFGPSADRGLYRSTDGGRSWAHVLKINDWTGVVDIAADPKSPNVLYAAAWEAHQYPWQSYFTPVTGAGSGIYKSTDGGATWARLAGAGWPAAPLGRIGLAVAGDRIYAAIDAEKDSHAAGLYRSDDAGATWRRVNDGEAFTGYYASRLTVSPADPDTLYTVGQSIRRCTGGGATCTIIKGAPGGDDYHHVWINPAHPDHMITGSDQGAVVSVNGGQSWSSWYNQPTGQFYHLAADNRFPYWVYSGQQDSGTVGIASRSDYGALTLRDWHPVGGDERDYDIPDPADPAIVYGSGLGGRVTKFDTRTGQVQNISPWPVSSYGKRQTTIKYHYLWATPLVASRAGPAALYLGAQVLFRSTDQGKTWQTISPDLTGKVANATGCDGIPSLAAAKACGYGAISAIEPSPKNPKEIWVGTDDGFIQTTSDGGATWRDVTPPGVPLWGKIASLDVSASEAGAVYAVVDGQRLDDFQPHIFRTTDGGKTWMPIAGGLPADHFASVVRSDPQKPGLLYAGTDAGVFVSFDDGGHWASLQDNLPTAWVRDLLVHGDDLIAATQGRALWVLDDLTPLRQLTPAVEAKTLHLFTPAAAWRIHPNNNADTPLPADEPQGENPPAGAAIDYWLGADASGPVTLEVLDGGGRVVRRWASDAAEAVPAAEKYFADSWIKPPEALQAGKGMHRVIWDLRYPRPAAINYTYSIAAVAGRDTPILPLGPLVLPGAYTVRLHAAGQTETAILTVRPDPRVKVSAADLRDSLSLSQRIGGGLAQARTGAAETAFLQSHLAPETVDAPDFSALDAILGAIEADLEAADATPTGAQLGAVDETLRQIAVAQSAWTDFKTTRLPSLNAARLQAGKPLVTLPPPTRFEAAPVAAGDDVP